MIQVEDLVKKYGGRTAVDHLSFTVEKGQIYGFLGPNGAGKSTTMNVMTGYIAANSGTVKINDYDILKEPEKAKRCIGYLPEIPPLYTDMTVREYLLFVAELKKVPKKERVSHVEEILEKIQLGEMQNRLIRNLSKGYKQRTGLAQALIGYPEILILDEPMVGLDPKQIIEMRDLIKSLGKDHTILLSSHILSEVSAVCDHVLIISHGRLAASGSPEELQEMMRGKAEIEVTVSGTEQQAREALQSVQGIEACETEDAAEAGSVRIRIRAAGDTDIRGEISVALAGAGLPILSMSRAEKSLEDIFLELTGEESESGAETEEPPQGEQVEKEETSGEEKGAAAEPEKAQNVEAEEVTEDGGDL